MENILNRIIIAFGYSFVFLFCLFFDQVSFEILGLILSIIVLFEFVEITKLPKRTLIIGLLFYLILNFFISENKFVINVFLTISIVVNLFLMFSLLMKKSFRFNKVQNSFFLLSYLVLSLFFLFSIPTLSNSYNPLSILFLLVIIWSSDSAGYFFGIKYGKRKLMESVSPKKTVVGFVSGIISSIIVSIIFALIINFENIFELILIGILISFIGSIGDLIESKFKRQYEVKDSGKILKSHGGMFDRLDSLIFVAPFIYLLYNFKVLLL